MERVERLKQSALALGVEASEWERFCELATRDSPTAQLFHEYLATGEGIETFWFRLAMLQYREKLEMTRTAILAIEQSPPPKIKAHGFMVGPFMQKGIGVTGER